MAFLLVAFPEINKTDFAWLQSHRAVHDELFYKIIEPHFTIVFPADNLEESVFVNEIDALAKGCKKIEFEITDAIVNKDVFSEYYYQFLVPGKGYDEIIVLHDRLYSGKLSSELRPDIDYIPHITIGNSKDEVECKKSVADFNSEGLFIKGSIDSLVILKYENNVVVKIKELWLV